MKNIFVLFCCMLSLSCFAQQKNNKHIVLVRLIDDSVDLKEEGGSNRLSTANKQFNRMLSNYEVDLFYKCVKNAKKESLKDLYEIHFKGDLHEFKSELDSYDIFKFDRELKIYEAITCNNPVPPVNDIRIADGEVNNYALELIEANCAWSVSRGKSDVVIGIADTEFENHEDLENQIIHVSGPISDMHQHGINVAGAASAETNNSLGIAGIGYYTKIAGYRVSHTIQSNGGATGSPYSAIMQAWNDGRKIINVSWSGTGLTSSEAEMITNSGTVLVVAAGNVPSSTSHSTISDIPGVINVSSVNHENKHDPDPDDPDIEPHAHNQWVDLCAPGHNVTTTKENDSYEGVWGTSFSAPIVAGTIGLMLAENPCLTPEEVEDILKATTDPIDDEHLFPGLLGAGRLNAYKAVLGAIEEGTKYIQSETYTSTALETSGASIYAGSNVTSELPTGDVVVEDGSDVIFHTSGRDVVLSGGFKVENNATFKVQSGDESTCPN